MLALRAACSRHSLNLLQLRQVHASVADSAPTAVPVQSKSPAATPADKTLKWTPDSIRTGLIARKRGMTAIWNDQGVRVPVTILQVSTGHTCLLVRYLASALARKLPSNSQYQICEEGQIYVPCSPGCCLGSLSKNNHQTNAWTFPKGQGPAKKNS